MRNMDEKPYTPDESRVAEFIWDRGLGGGDDPIGFILASYAYLAADRSDLRRVNDSLVAALNEAVLQIEYLHEKIGKETGSGNFVLACARRALARCSSQVEQPSDV